MAGNYVTKKQIVDLTQEYDLLFQLGVNACYSGFFHAAHAIRLAREDPCRMILVTKWLYPEVAKAYGTNWRAIERNIRLTIRAVWRANPDLLCDMAMHRLYSRPTPTEFISICAAHLSRNT